MRMLDFELAKQSPWCIYGLRVYDTQSDTTQAEPKAPSVVL